MNVTERYSAMGRGPRVAWFIHNGVKHHVHADYLRIPNGYPQLDSDDWIEYIPAPGIVERDGDLWWRYFDDGKDCFCYAQLTKGASGERYR